MLSRKNYIKTEENIEFQFDGEKGIDIETLIASLEYTKTVLKSTKNNVAGIEDYEIIVEPFKEGSFIVAIKVLAYSLVELIPSILTMGEVFTQTFKIWKTLRGKPPKEVIRNEMNNTIKIVGDNNTVVVSPETLNVVTDTKKIAEDLSNISKKMSKDSSRTGNIKLTVAKDDDVEILELDKETVETLKNPVFLKDSISKEEVTVSHIVLKPGTVKFDNIDDWVFYSSLSEKPIKAKIEDSEFRRKVSEGVITFGSETRIEVILQTTTSTLTDGSEKKTTEHKILKVEKVIDAEKVDQLKADI